MKNMIKISILNISTGAVIEVAVGGVIDSTGWA